MKFWKKNNWMAKNQYLLIITILMPPGADEPQFSWKTDSIFKGIQLGGIKSIWIFGGKNIIWSFWLFWALLSFWGCLDGGTTSTRGKLLSDLRLMWSLKLIKTKKSEKPIKPVKPIKLVKHMNPVKCTKPVKPYKTSKTL